MAEPNTGQVRKQDRRGAPDGNLSRQVHGGEGAIVAIRKGVPFSGIAQQIYLDLVAESGIDLDTLPGLDRIAVLRVLRMETAARCFDGAALAAAEAGDLDRWERMQQRAGWLGGKFLSGVRDIRQALADDAQVIDAAIVAAREHE